MQDSILRLADKAGIVSFDVFDTLLYRPFLRGDDQLLYLELAHHVDGWLKARKQAEKDILAEEITESPCLEAIYERLPQKWQFMYEEEHRFERAILRPNPEMAEVFRRLKAVGKRLIVVSDMYLKKEVIADLLKNCGFEGFEDIPIPQGMTQTESDNISFGNEETRLVEAYLTGSKTQFKDVEAFYINTLPQLGWTFQGKQGNAISFYRDGEKLDIVREQKSPLLVRITIKSQN